MRKPVLYIRFPKNLIIILALLFLTSLACSSGSSAEEIKPPGGHIPVSEEAAERLKQNFYQALQEASNNHESQLRVTNEEMTSLFARELTETGRIPMRVPQIWFTSGRIYISGEVSPLGPLTFDSLIVATAIVDEGQLVVKVQEAQMGSFDFPEAFLESMTQTVNESLANSLIDLDITRLEILEGEIFVLGTRSDL
jgi:hypothetical protein